MNGGGTTKERLTVLHVAPVDVGGGAAGVASRLQRGLERHGCASWLAVGRKSGDGANTIEIPLGSSRVARALGYDASQTLIRALAARYPGRGFGSIGRLLRLATHPIALADWLAGREDFTFPATRHLLALPPARPDVLHCHNLHGGYFDLEALTVLSAQVPTALTLHDEWLFTGHCACSLDCERWRTGCGECPDLTIDPAIRRDATAENWRRKRRIFAASPVYPVSPSRWLLDRLHDSMVAPAVRLSRVIPNGIDLEVFRPGDQASARRDLGFRDDFTVLLVGSGQTSTWRDEVMLRATLSRLLSNHNATSAIQLVAVGQPGTMLRKPEMPIRFDGYQPRPEMMARYYQAADVYLHLARTDNFPTTVVEALACGTPVVATNVGGIPEQICNWDVRAGRSLSDAGQLTEETGVLVTRGDDAMAAAAVELLRQQPQARCALARNAARHARERFDVDQQIACYLDWYGAIIDDWNRHVV